MPPEPQKNPLPGDFWLHGDYWLHLEFRICRELEPIRGVEFTFLWCDGFEPEAIVMLDDGPHYVGHAWMGRGGLRQWKWRFALALPEGITTREQINWPSLYPADDVTGWLSLDQNRRHLRIRPADAYPIGRPPDWEPIEWANGGRRVYVEG